MHGAVVGAGLAGIAMTHALRRIGISVDLFEQAPEARSTGYQLNVLQNGKYALEQIGLLDALRNSGYGAPMNAIVFINGLTGRIMVRAALVTAGDYVATSFYRGDLHKTLVEALEGEAPQCNRAVEVVDDDASRGKVILRFADGEARDFDFVIGADGAHSKIRCHIFPEHRGFLPCFHALLFAAHIDLNGSSAAERSFAEQVRQGEFVIIIAPGTEVVLSAAGGGRFGVIMRFDDPRRAREVSTPEDAKALARTLARDIRDPRIHLAIDLSFWEPGNPLIWHIGDIDPSRKFHAGRIALSGDAAHAMLPVVGQGANQAFEDAMVLARQLGSRGDSDIAPAFERYSAERALHVAHVQQTGRRYARG
jgi:2-polyprenyl-6-methoxyphenol hydroxylase-like FAD-dependent oxidoreductase